MRWGFLILFLIVLVALAPRSYAVCSITGDDTVECDGVTYRALDEEGLYFVDLAQHNAAHPGVALPDRRKTLADNHGPTAAIQPVLVALTDFVDCTRTDHNFSHANIIPTSDHPNRPSRLMNISGKTFRVTAAPDDGFACYYYSYDMATGGAAGVPHLLMAESSNDQERYTSLIVHHPDDLLVSNTGGYWPRWASYGWASPYAGEPTNEPWGKDWWVMNPQHTQQGPVFAPDVGLTTYTGREMPIDNQPFTIGLLFHPKSAVERIVVSSLGCNVARTSNDGGAVSRMWSFKFVDRMADRYPAQSPPPDPASFVPRAAGPPVKTLAGKPPVAQQKQRLIGIHMTHPWFFYAHYGTPVRTLAQRQQGLRRVVEHLKFCGMNYIAFNAINGSDRSEKAWYPGSQYFAWNSAGDLLSELPPIAETEGMQLVPLITSLQATDSNGLIIAPPALQMNASGAYTKAFGKATLDPLHPIVQSLTFDLLNEIASRVQSSPAVRGIGVRVNGKIGTCYTADESGQRGARTSGYSSWDLQQFKDETGSGVPVYPPATAYDWLVARPAEWERWITWRCQRTRAFWLACRDLIKTYRPDWTFYVQADLPSEVPGTNIEWANGETPYDLLRHHGYDPNLFVNDTGIVITRGMMVAADRFYVRTRWAEPFGSNYEYYRLFHFAPGLAELYRTAEGRACDFYQNYWEESSNPYYEYGWSDSGYFRTTTPAAAGRAFFAPATMSLRRQDPDTMTWLGWNRPTLGHENEIRGFAQAFRALPAEPAVAFEGMVSPDLPEEVVVRWHGSRLAVINDSPSARTITLTFKPRVPPGEEVVNVTTGHVLVAADAANRISASLYADAYSLNTYRFSSEQPPISSIPGDFDGDRDVDQEDFAHIQACSSGFGIAQDSPECLDARMDNDLDVDGDDMAIFKQCMRGPGTTGDPNCAG